MSTPTEIISKIINSSSITSRFEAVYVAFHASLIANGFKCIGLENESAANEEAPAYDLPSGWNKTEIFALRYQCNSDHKPLVKALAIDNILAINVLTADNDIASISIDVNRYIDNDQLCNKNESENIYKELAELIKIMTTFILQKLYKEDNKSLPKNSSYSMANFIQQSVPSRPRDYQDDDPLRIGPAHVPRPRYERPLFNPDGDRIPGIGGGSMLFDPLRSGGIRPPSRPERFPSGNIIPPRARHDPVHPFDFDPSGRNLRRGERFNPDHLPPPGFGSGFDPFI